MTSPEGPATVSTLAEARYFAENGVKDILYAVGIAPQKLAEVDAIRHETGCDLKIILDSAEAAKLVSDFCRAHHTNLPVLLEIDVDGHRSGLLPDSPDIVTTARALTDGAYLKGVLTHAGDSYECKTQEAIAAAAEQERAGIVKAADMLRAAGFTVDIISVGSSPTLMRSASEAGVTEIRAGVCAFFDLFMTNVGICTVDDIAGSVLTTVIGRKTNKNRVITDSGFLAMSRDRGTPRQKKDYGYGLVCDVDGHPLDEGKILLAGTNQEHGIIDLPENTPPSPKPTFRSDGACASSPITPAPRPPRTRTFSSLKTASSSTSSVTYAAGRFSSKSNKSDSPAAFSLGLRFPQNRTEQEIAHGGTPHSLRKDR